jgi:protein SCO1/2
MSQRLITILLGLSVGVLAISAGLLLRTIWDGRTASNTGSLATAVDFGAPFTLTDYNGDPITEAAFQGAPSLLFFGFTRCPEICPTTVYDIDTWLLDLGEDAKDVRAYFISVDPERDTPEFLAEYLKPQSDRVIGITGTPEDVWEMARSWRVYWQKRPLGDGEYTLDHFASIYVLDPQGRVRDKISYGEDPASAKAKILSAVNS